MKKNTILSILFILSFLTLNSMTPEMPTQRDIDEFNQSVEHIHTQFKKDFKVPLSYDVPEIFKIAKGHSKKGLHIDAHEWHIAAALKNPFFRENNIFTYSYAQNLWNHLHKEDYPRVEYCLRAFAGSKCIQAYNLLFEWYIFTQNIQQAEIASVSSTRYGNPKAYGQLHDFFDEKSKYNHKDLKIKAFMYLQKDNHEPNALNIGHLWLEQTLIAIKEGNSSLASLHLKKAREAYQKAINEKIEHAEFYLEQLEVLSSSLSFS